MHEVIEGRNEGLLRSGLHRSRRAALAHGGQGLVDRLAAGHQQASRLEKHEMSTIAHAIMSKVVTGTDCNCGENRPAESMPVTQPARLPVNARISAFAMNRLCMEAADTPSARSMATSLFRSLTLFPYRNSNRKIDTSVMKTENSSENPDKVLRRLARES